MPMTCRDRPRVAAMESRSLSPTRPQTITLVDFESRPRFQVRLTAVCKRAFGENAAADTTIDDSPVRSLRSLAREIPRRQLAPLQLADSDELIDPFELLYPPTRIG